MLTHAKALTGKRRRRPPVSGYHLSHTTYQQRKEGRPLTNGTREIFFRTYGGHHKRRSSHFMFTCQRNTDLQQLETGRR